MTVRIAQWLNESMPQMKTYWHWEVQGKLSNKWNDRNDALDEKILVLQSTRKHKNKQIDTIDTDKNGALDVLALEKYKESTKVNRLTQMVLSMNK